MRYALLILLALCAGVILSALWVWYFVFKKSVRKLIFSAVGIALGRDTKVDPNAPIEPLQDEPLSTVLEERAQTSDFDEVLAKHQPPSKPPQAQIPPEERGEKARDTSDNGWPRQLDDAVRLDPRPFREVHLRTENEQTHELLDVDAYEISKSEPDDTVE